MTVRSGVSQELVHELLDYDPATGCFVWRERPRSMFTSDRNQRKWNTRYAGEGAGSFYSNGYRRIAIHQRHYLAHRLAWLYIHGEWPPQQIDHINGDRTDNRIANLRLAEHSQNAWNSKTPVDSESGVKGVGWSQKDKRWRARITVNGRQHCVGYFKSLDQAREAIVAERQKLHGQFCNHG